MADVDLLSTHSAVRVEAQPRVLSLDDAGRIFEVLSSATARRILGAVYESPAPPSEIAAAVDTTVQNVGYHLDRLESAGLVGVVETRYSEKGVEMDVYAPAHAPLVIRADADGRT